MRTPLEWDLRKLLENYIDINEIYLKYVIPCNMNVEDHKRIVDLQQSNVNILMNMRKRELDSKGEK